MSSPPSKMHINEQYAPALLGPMRDQLNDLELRLTRFLERLELTDRDADLIAQARLAIASARQELSRLHQEADKS